MASRMRMAFGILCERGCHGTEVHGQPECGRTRKPCSSFCGPGPARARSLTRARVLLKADDGLTDGEVAAALGIGVATVHRIRQRCVEEGLDAALGNARAPAAPPSSRRSSMRM